MTQSPLTGRLDSSARASGRPLLAAEYVVPLRWAIGAETGEFTGYLRSLAGLVDVTVVDGSEGSAFDHHREVWGGAARLLRPDPWPGRNGKVAGVVTGVRHARHEIVVLADDDVRYTAEQLRRAVEEFRRCGADVLRPQNRFSPMPWHARWDTGRSLVNRAFGSDHPGTFVLRRSTFLRMGGYDGDVLFENLQMLRSFAAAGGREHRAPDLYVDRRPPTAGTFVCQRVRQAYDDFAQPGRLAVELALLPLLSMIAARWPRALPLLVGAAVVVAETGRRRHGGARAFPASAALWAPVWVIERAVCVWLAVLERLRGGVRYRGRRLPHAALPPRPRPPLTPAGPDGSALDPAPPGPTAPGAARAPQPSPPMERVW